MEIANLLLCLVACVGMTQIIVESELSNSIKDATKSFLPKFLFRIAGCYQCCGFWTGIFMGLIFYMPNQIGFCEYGKVFATGCAASSLSYFYAVFLMYIEANTMVKTHE